MVRTAPFGAAAAPVGARLELAVCRCHRARMTQPGHPTLPPLARRPEKARAANPDATIQCVAPVPAPAARPVRRAPRVVRRALRSARHDGEARAARAARAVMPGSGGRRQAAGARRLRRAAGGRRQESGGRRQDSSARSSRQTWRLDAECARSSRRRPRSAAGRVWAPFANALNHTRLYGCDDASKALLRGRLDFALLHARRAAYSWTRSDPRSG